MRKNIWNCISVFLLAWFVTGGVLAQNTMHLVATNNCGVDGEQPFLVLGENYTMPESVGGTGAVRTCNFGGKVIYAFNHLDIQADYELEVAYLVDSDRQQHIVVDGNEVQGPTDLTAKKEARFRFKLPRKAFAYHQLVLVFEALKGPNAVVSELKLYSSNPKKPEPFSQEDKQALKNTPSYHVDTTFNIEDYIPVYAATPASVTGVYRPVVSLNGVWAFRERSNDDKAPWKQIVVPGEWTMQGCKVDSAGFGRYRRTFDVPTDWNGKTMKLRFDAVASECIVYLNGREAGKHLGGLTAFELDATPYLKPGQNTVEVSVRSESLADMLGSFTQYAAHQMGGITRKVTLFAVPDVHISDLRIVTDLDEAYKDAELRIYATINNNSRQKQSGHKLTLTVDGLPVSIVQDIPAIEAGKSWSGWLKGKVMSPKKWNSEHPNRYTLLASLSQNGAETEQVQKKFGFREVEVKGNTLYVNGTAVKLRGVCRHEVHPLTGRVIPADLARKDAELYRAGNCNFIRTSHYPPSEEFIEICDEVGLFVELEAPVCWVGHHANENWTRLNYRDDKYYDYIRQANIETVHFYRNHPSILFWSLANESYWNKNFAQVQEYVRKADPTRPRTFHDQSYGGFNNQGSTTPIANIHYPGPGGYKMGPKNERPLIYGEYCHLNVYNRSELVTDPGIRSDWALAIAPTWENMYKTQGILGGSIWSGIDDIFQLPDGNAVGYGAWGPIDGWRRPKPEYWDMKKSYSPIRVRTRNLSPAATLGIDIENRYFFTNLNEIRTTWTYGNEEGVMQIDLAPGQSGKFNIAVKNPSAANELHLKFYSPDGVLVDEELIAVGRQEQNELPDVTTASTKLKKTAQAFRITGKDFLCEISRTTGQIITLTRENTPYLCGGPLLMALPLTGGGCYPNHNANTPVFNDVCKNWKAASVEAEKKGESVVVTVKGSYDEMEGSYTLTINANGELKADYNFTSKQNVNPRQWGLVFEAPKAFNRNYWRREGIWSNYPADHISRPSGEAMLFYADAPKNANPRIAPACSWSHDANELGSSDFRSTRRNIWYAGLKTAKDQNITVRSNGKQHWRSWLEGDRCIRFLVADFVTAGDEMFLGSYYGPYRKPIKKGDNISGSIQLRNGIDKK